MSRIIHVNFHDHNKLGELDRRIAILLSMQKSVGESLEFVTQQRIRYMKEYKLSVIPSMAEMANKYGGLRRMTLRINDYTKKLDQLELGLINVSKERDRILGRYPEDKY